MMEFPEFVLIAGHSIGMGPVMRLGQDDTNRVSVGVTTCSSAGRDNNIDDNDDLIPGTGQADDD